MAFAQQQTADVLLLKDGEKLIGHLVRSNGGTLHFKSDSIGEVSVDWSKVNELHTAQPYAVVSKDVNRGRTAATSDVPVGPITVAEQKIDVAAADGPKTVAVADAANILDVPTFERAFRRNQGLLTGWRGSITAGASLVEATQKNRTFNESVSLIRGIPSEEWLPRRDRTVFDFTSSYGKQSQPNSAPIRTSIFHANGERDEYFSASAYGFGQVQFDHNVSQGLDLQQTYAGGVGWSAIKRANEGLDLKAGFSFIRQQFSGAKTPNNLASSVFDERFVRRFGRGATFTQELGVSPSWTNSSEFSAFGNATLALPVYKRFTFTTGVIENYLHDPPPGFRKNSLQFVTGLTYVLP